MPQKQHEQGGIFFFFFLCGLRVIGRVNVYSGVRISQLWAVTCDCVAST